MRIGPHQIKPTDSAGAAVADGQYVAAVVDGVLVGLEPVAAPTPDTPLVTVVNGVPGLVFDDDGQIVYTEVPS